MGVDEGAAGCDAGGPGTSARALFSSCPAVSAFIVGEDAGGSEVACKLGVSADSGTLGGVSCAVVLMIMCGWESQKRTAKIIAVETQSQGRNS